MDKEMLIAEYPTAYETVHDVLQTDDSETNNLETKLNKYAYILLLFQINALSVTSRCSKWIVYLFKQFQNFNRKQDTSTS